MELEKYLTKIKECPDNNLPFKHGIYPGFPILCGTKESEVFEFLNNNKNYKYAGESENSKGFYYLGGHVSLELSSLIKIENVNPEILKLGEKHNVSYETFLLLNQYNPIENKKVNYLRAFANVVENISKDFILEKNIPICFMYSQGWDNINSKDLVYFPIK